MQHQLIRIVIIGPESTGKSTLASQLAAFFSTSFAGEYARHYLENLGRPYEQDDLIRIAEGQLAIEAAAAAQSTGNLVFLDTDLYVIKVWSEDKYGTCTEQILRAIATRRYDYYILTGIDMPWQDDPLREHPEPLMRLYFHHVYHDIVQQSGVPFTAVSGDEAGRLSMAVQAIEHTFPHISGNRA